MIKVTTTIALVVALCQMILDDKKPNKENARLLEAIANHASALVRSWSGSNLSPKVMKQIGFILNECETHFAEKKTYFTFCLGMIDDLLEYVDGWKADNLKTLRGKVLEAYAMYSPEQRLEAMATEKALAVYDSKLLQSELMGY